MLSLAQSFPVFHPVGMATGPDDDDETRLLGRALRELRRRAGMTLAEAGDALEPRAISGQGWGLYEAGRRDGIHHPRTQARLTRAVMASVEELMVQRARLAGLPEPEPAAMPNGVAERAPRSYVAPVISRPRAQTDQLGGIVYDARHADSTVDLAWIFGPTAGRLRMGDDRLKGHVNAGQMIHYDRATPPRAGQVSVIETKDGGLHPYLFRQIVGGLLNAEQTNPPATIEFGMDGVRGVYAVRLIGD